MSNVKLICPICNNGYEKTTSHYNRAMKLGVPVYCGKVCSGIGRRSKKTPEQLKKEKSTYDKQRLNGSKRTEILESKKAYHYANREIINAKQRIRNKQRMPQHVEYCRRPDQRAKEKIRRHIRLGQTAPKECLICKETKQLIDFSAYAIFPDKRNYMCKDCEKNDIKELGIDMRHSLQCIRSALRKSGSKLKIQDIAKYPYLLEANKYLLLIKRLIK